MDGEAPKGEGRRRCVTILHVSDVHFGKPHLPAVRDAVVRFAHDARPDAVVVSGDLTQRAKRGEFRAARAFLDVLEPYPVIVTAGNHDVPLYRFWERLFAPYRNYRAIIGPELDTVLDIRTGGGERRVRLVALNSSSPRTAIVNGRLFGRQLDFAKRSFGSAGPGTFRLLVIHHNLISPPGYTTAPPLPGADRILAILQGMGVDLILSGHIHQSFFGWSGRTPPGPGPGEVGIPIVLAGTASSSRGRGKEVGRNSFNLVRVVQSGVEATAYLYSRDAGCFLPGEGRRYPGVRVTRPSRGLVEKGSPRGEEGAHP